MKIATKIGFTLTEIMVVVIAIAIMAAFAIPSYTKTVERAHLRDSITQLSTIYAAHEIYKTQTGGYWPDGTVEGLASINSNLGLNILANGMVYTCEGDQFSFSCSAVRQPPAPTFTLTLTDAVLSSSNPSCSGACP